ncbi:2-keto-4-pentenoate hydratase [Bacillus piscicola]|uniref:2-keto-4-pentenoate hydratase n=1 Tax=Bacillus piscicola TaxID=1632684 RepID=UPI001F09F72B|nr:2-keto-4-pentenoate hydratase [Bacillus piscicola]
MVDQSTIIQLAEKLHDAEITGNGVEPLTSSYPALTAEEAYYIQLENVKRKTDSGRRITGKKIGLTSLAMQELLGVNEPDYGHLFDDMAIGNRGVVPAGKLIYPRIEGEIAFVLNKDIKGPGITTHDILQATEYVLPAIEIVDSRVKDWQIKLEDTIADNASSGLYVLGDEPISPKGLDLSQLGMVLYKNGELINTGAGAAAMNHPARCVAWLANRLSHFDISLKAGEVILSGALSKAVDGKHGDLFEIELEKLGSVSVTL